MNIEKNCIVGISYTLTNDAGEQIDQSPDGEPLMYLHGAAGVLPALESELEGKQAGDTFDVTITPAAGFGEHQPELTHVAEKSSFPPDVTIEVGMQLTAEGPEGEMQVTVTAIDDESVTIDANHPLAGMTLRFKGEITSVRAASGEEIQHWPNPAPGAG